MIAEPEKQKDDDAPERSLASGPRLNGFALLDRQLVESARARMKESILRHRASPAEESRKLGEALEEVYLQLGMALRRFDDLRDLWGDRLEPR